MANNKSRIEQLLTMAMNSESEARTLAIVEQILEIDPDQTEALILKADNTEQDSKRVKILEHALRSVKKISDPEEAQMLELLIYKRLEYTLYSDGRHDEAYEACMKILQAPEEIYNEIEEDGSTKLLYYRLLIERCEWQRILTETMQDSEHSPAWAYARLSAAFMLSPDSKRNQICAGMFWDALILSPDIPFYMLGYNPEPDDNESPEVYYAFNFAVIYYDILSISDDFRDFFTRGVILFGLLSNRFDGREREYMLDVLDTLGGYDEYEKMSRILLENDDTAIIEALAAHKCLSE